MKRYLLILGSLLLAATGWAAELAPFSSSADLTKLSEQESRVWRIAQETDKAIAAGGYVIDNDEGMNSYLRAVARRLYPEFVDTIVVRVLKDPELNAFALPNGSIYINTGILARMENEAQLAALLGHEIAHFTHRHGYQGHQQQKSSSALAASIRALGIPGVGELVALSSIYGFSREMEAVADNIGFQRMQQAGYDSKEAVKIFDLLVFYAQKQDLKQPYFFSTHPKLKERIAHYNELIAGAATTGISNPDPFLQATRRVRMEFLREEIDAGHFNPVIWLLDNAQQGQSYPIEAQHYLGEAYRLRNQPGDAALAEQRYQEVARSVPDYAPPVRALGLICMRRRDYACVVQRLGWYLELAPDAADAAYMRQYYDQAKAQMDKVRE